MTEVTVATGRKQVLQPWEYFLRPLHQETFEVRCEEGYDSFGKSWTRTKPRGVSVHSHSCLYLNACVWNEGRGKRLDLESEFERLSSL